MDIFTIFLFLVFLKVVLSGISSLGLVTEIFCFIKIWKSEVNNFSYFCVL